MGFHEPTGRGAVAGHVAAGPEMLMDGGDAGQFPSAGDPNTRAERRPSRSVARVLKCDPPEFRSRSLPQPGHLCSLIAQTFAHWGIVAETRNPIARLTQNIGETAA